MPTNSTNADKNSIKKIVFFSFNNLFIQVLFYTDSVDVTKGGFDIKGLSRSQKMASLLLANGVTIVTLWLEPVP